MQHSHGITRRTALKGAAALGLAASGIVSRAHGAAFPSKPIEVVIGFEPGGGTDRSARLVGPAWAKALGSPYPFKFTNMPGAGAVIALVHTLKARPDGHVINAVPGPHVAWIFELKRAKGYTPEDIAFIGAYFDDPNVLLVKKDAKWNRIDEFIEDARKTKTPFTVSVSTPMSAAHAATVVLRELTGANLKVVSFQGGSAARNAVAGGHVTACLAPYWSALHVLELTKGIGILQDANPAPHLWTPVPANQVLDVKIPNLSEPYLFLVSAAVKKEHPENYRKLVDSMKVMHGSEEFRKAADAQDLTPFLKYMSPEECEAFMKDYLDLLKTYRPAMEKDLQSM